MSYRRPSDNDAFGQQTADSRRRRICKGRPTGRHSSNQGSQPTIITHQTWAFPSTRLTRCRGVTALAIPLSHRGPGSSWCSSVSRSGREKRPPPPPLRLLLRPPSRSRGPPNVLRLPQAPVRSSGVLFTFPVAASAILRRSRSTIQRWRHVTATTVRHSGVRETSSLTWSSAPTAARTRPSTCRIKRPLLHTDIQLRLARDGSSVPSL